LAVAFLDGCAARELELVDGADFRQHVQPGPDARGEALASLRFRASVCEGLDLTPSYSRLSEEHLIRFLESRGLAVRVERPRADLAYVVVDDGRTRAPARLRVAILEDADSAGSELSRAIEEHGSGSWGVHRANLAVLGPVGDVAHDLAFAAETRLVCWGVLTISGREEPVVIPGGYREL
jgi:hypothetical protein